MKKWHLILQLKTNAKQIAVIYNNDTTIATLRSLFCIKNEKRGPYLLTSQSKENDVAAL